LQTIRYCVEGRPSHLIFGETRFHVVGSIRYSGGKMAILRPAKVGTALSRNSREVGA
jgi:hypothetical protein